MLSMIAAIGKNRELGRGHLLPWDIPEDMKYFQDMTRNHVVIMGQKTFEAIGFPLPKRMNIVLTHDKDFSPDGVIVSRSPEEALRLARKEEKNGEIFIIGGASIYSIFLEQSDRLYLTLIEDVFPEADIFFPEYEKIFSKIKSSYDGKDENYSYRFVVFEKNI
ncbi:MAG: dihydrofolate reductase [Candidatus Moraniibacteriota bacterium]|nr:MAG: dihydrofolate reductase [Candidatus Moranbacteria bacterium]